MSRSVAFSTLLVVLTPLTGLAQLVGGTESTIKVEMKSGQSVSGTIFLPGILIDCDLGRYAIKTEKIKAIRFTRPTGTVTQEGTSVEGVVVTTSGDEISGTVFVQEWSVRTDLGDLTLDPAKLKVISFTDRNEPSTEKK